MSGMRAVTVKGLPDLKVSRHTNRICHVYGVGAPFCGTALAVLRVAGGGHYQGCTTERSTNSVNVTDPIGVSRCFLVR